MAKPLEYEYELEELGGIWATLEPADLRDRLRRIWPNLIAPYKRELRAGIVPMFRRAGYVSDGPPTPLAELVVFRGELAGQVDHGISWTTDRATATVSAGRWSTATGAVVVLKARAPFGSVLAQFTANNEAVVDTTLLLEVQPLIGPTSFTYPEHS